MSSRSKVAVLFTRPETAIEDHRRLFDLAGGAEALQVDTTTILKDNICLLYTSPSPRDRS